MSVVPQVNPSMPEGPDTLWIKLKPISSSASRQDVESQRASSQRRSDAGRTFGRSRKLGWPLVALMADVQPASHADTTSSSVLARTREHQQVGQREGLSCSLHVLLPPLPRQWAAKPGTESGSQPNPATVLWATLPATWAANWGLTH